MKKRQHTIIALLVLTFTTFALAQEAKLKKANKNFEDLSYIEAADVYEIIAESGYKSQDLFQKLGDSYYFNANYNAAHKWYTKLFNFSNEIKPKYYLRYSQVLNNVGDIAKAKTYYEQFLLKIDKNSLLTVDDYLDRIEKNSDRYQIKNANINTNGVDFGGEVLNGQYLYFTSTGDTTTYRGFKTHSWNNLPFMNIYAAKISDDFTLDKAEKIKGKVNTGFHETSPTFTSDGKTMYFTRNNVNSEDNVNRLKIYRATLKDGKWKDVEDLSINNDLYSNAHPSLSADNTTLFFVSDRPGGYGMTDIYSVRINEDGSFQKVYNLGDFINTPGRESFPHITSKNELYFSSDGHFGLGGYDVFYTDLNEKNPELYNVGKPINSLFDDIAFTINDTTRKGFFSSNRAGGKGLDDIYLFIENKPIDKLKSKLIVKVIDKITKAPIQSATVKFYDIKTNLITSLTTDNVGESQALLPISQQYLVRSSKESYNTQEDVTFLENKEQLLVFELEKEHKEISVGTDIAQLLNIENIYFDFDKSYIRPDAQIELTKVLKLMNKYPLLKIDIRSHTDSRANDAYNLALSDKRAKSTMQFLINNGIAPSRLSAKGYGETQLKNKCSNGVSCTKEEHQFNRRSEFIVVKN